MAGTEPGTASRRASARRLILLVDDEPDTLTSLKEFVESQLEARAIVAPDAETALRLLAEVKPDLLIVDQSLPGMSGLELVKEARRIHPTLPAFVVTGHAHLAAGLAELDHDGLTQVYMKPLATRPFAERLRKALR